MQEYFTVLMCQLCMISKKVFESWTFYIPVTGQCAFFKLVINESLLCYIPAIASIAWWINTQYMYAQLRLYNFHDRLYK